MQEWSLHRMIIFTGVAGILISFLFVGVVRRFSRPAMGNYRVLMIVIGLFHIAFCAVGLLVMPGLYIQQRSFVFVGHGPVAWFPLKVGHIFLVLWTAMLQSSICIILYQFMYRYIEACREKWRWIFATTSGTWYLIIFYFSVLVIFAVNTCSFDQELKGKHTELWRELGIDINTTAITGLSFDSGHTAVNQPQNVSLQQRITPNSVNNILFVSLFLITIFFGLRTFATLRMSMVNPENKALRYHSNIFKALTITSLLVFFLAFLPFFLMQIFAYNDVQLGESANFIVIVISLYPVIYPIFAVNFNRDYKRAVVRLVCPGPGTPSISVIQASRRTATKSSGRSTKTQF